MLSGVNCIWYKPNVRTDGPGVEGRSRVCCEAEPASGGASNVSVAAFSISVNYI